MKIKVLENEELSTVIQPRFVSFVILPFFRDAYSIKTSA